MIKWTPRFSVSDETIDMQHQKLFSIMNDIIEAMKTSKADDRAFISEILKRLLDYTEYHFREEEIKFNATKKKKKTEHIRAHKEFIKKVEEMISKKDKGIPSLNAIQISNLTYSWLSNHILNFDKTYTDYITGKIK